jgi:dTDP-4-amino-4,6-dideoxygalactose transaminase
MQTNDTAGLIPPFRVEFTPDESREILANIAQVLQAGRLMLGPITTRFEDMFAATVGLRHAVSVNSGSTALEIIYRYIGSAGRDVLVPTNTNFATAAAAIHAGATPVFYDSGLYPDIEDIQRKTTARTRAIVVVHIGGYISPEIPRLRQFCDSRGVLLIEDAAHAHHATLDGVQAGAFGHAAAFSFFPTKVITTGEGGIIVTNDDAMAAASRSYRDQGKDASGIIHVNMGNSWRLTECGAAIGLAMLPSLAHDTAERLRMMDRYERELAGCPGLTFPQLPSGSKPSGYKSVAMLELGLNRAKFSALLAENGVTISRPVYEVPLHRQPVFQQWISGSFPMADDFCDRHICLPLWRFLSNEQQTAVIGALRASCAGLLSGVA